MKPRFSRNVHFLAFYYSHNRRFLHTRRRTFSSFLNNIRSNQSGSRASFLGGGGGGTGDSKVATILMLGALHARRLYEDQKASFLGILPLRSISRAWGSLMSMKIPVWMRPYAYKAWARAFHSNLEGRLFPVNERATRTIRNLYVENERVVLEGIWKEGFMALAAVGATNIGSIELFIEPELRTNKPKKKLFPTEPPEERVYDPEGHGLMIEKGKEVGVFNMGSTVVLVIQAPTAKSPDGSRSSSDYQFCVKKGDRVHVGQALGKKNEYKVLCTNNIQHSCFWLGFAYYAPT